MAYSKHLNSRGRSDQSNTGRQSRDDDRGGYGDRSGYGDRGRQSGTAFGNGRPQQRYQQGQGPRVQAPHAGLFISLKDNGQNVYVALDNPDYAAEFLVRDYNNQAHGTLVRLVHAYEHSNRYQVAPQMRETTLAQVFADYVHDKRAACTRVRELVASMAATSLLNACIAQAERPLEAGHPIFQTITWALQNCDLPISTKMITDENEPLVPSNLGISMLRELLQGR